MTYPCCSMSACIPRRELSRVSRGWTTAGGVCRSCGGSTRSGLVTAIAVGTLHTPRSLRRALHCGGVVNHRPRSPLFRHGLSHMATDRHCDALLHQHLIHGMPPSTPTSRDQLTEGAGVINAE